MLTEGGTNSAFKVGDVWIDDVREVKNFVKTHFESSYSESECYRLVIDGVPFAVRTLLD